MMSSMILLACLFCLLAISTNATSSNSLRVPTEDSNSEKSHHRQLQFDALFHTDLCKNGPGDNDVGPCDISRFPICAPGETRCYNRKVWRDKFHTDIKQPMHYIDYDLVLCYPEGSRVCSSCSPGRYCESEGRCILDELNYDCAVWL